LSLRKSPTRTPALLEANRRNAQQSTGPWTPRGKAQSCLNRLKTGKRSRVYRGLWLGLLDAPPCAVLRTAHALLTPEQAAHPVFAELVDLSRWAEGMAAMDERWFRELEAANQKAWASSEKERQEPSGAETGSAFTFMRLGGNDKKRMLEIDVGSRNVIENTRNTDILSRYPADILGSSKAVLTENAHLGATRVTFSMRFGHQCTALAMPRCEPQDLPDGWRRNHHRLALDVDLNTRRVLVGPEGPGVTTPASQGAGLEPALERSGISSSAQKVADLRHR